ncbi:MAG: hypothetical protein WC460_05740 [Patescibacteria group bacterium]
MSEKKIDRLGRKENIWPRKELERIFELAKRDEIRWEKMQKIDESKLRQRITFPGFENL